MRTTDRASKDGNAELDVEDISDPGIRTQYVHQVRRFASLSRSVESAYGLGEGAIKTRLIRESEFNARVGKKGGGYDITITSSVPLLLMIYFDKLLAQPGVMTWLGPTDDGPVSYDFPFSVDPSDLWQRRDWQIRTNQARAFAAYTLSDIATTFMFLHELGHVLGGHLEALSSLHCGGELAEFYHRQHGPKVDVEYLQCWEYEADAIAATFITHYVEELIETVGVDERAHAVFGPKEVAVEQCISLCVSALYALFAYLRGTSLNVDMEETHPDPLVRAFYLRDLLWRALAPKLSINKDLCLDMMEARFEEFSTALAAFDLQSPNAFSDEHFDSIDAGVDAIKALHKKHRKFTTAFSRVAWT